MKSTMFPRVISTFLIVFLVVTQTWATCGGGGGGGMGGMGGGGGSAPQTYMVPWKVVQSADTLKEGLAVYWLPASQVEVERSSLRESRTLSNYASQCVTMGIVDQKTAVGQKFAQPNQLPVAVVVQADGTEVARLENKNGKLTVGDLEKLLDNEMKKRENAVKEKLESAKSKAKAGDNDGAITELKAVYEQKCVFPSRAKDAAKELKKLGVQVSAVPDGPNFDPALST